MPRHYHVIQLILTSSRPIQPYAILLPRLRVVALRACLPA